LVEDEFVVEQLLNLLWAALALGTLSAFWLRQRAGVGRTMATHPMALIALLTALIIIFPVISVSDDLHPTMADVADPAKRILQVAPQLHQLQSVPSTVFLVSFLVFQVSSALVSRPDWFLEDTAVRALVRERVPNDGRSPPRF
jgi:hypothetical protein